MAPGGITSRANPLVNWNTSNPRGTVVYANGSRAGHSASTDRVSPFPATTHTADRGPRFQA